MKVSTDNVKRDTKRPMLLGTLATVGGTSLLVGGVLLGQTSQPAPQVTPAISTTSATSATVGGDVPYTPSKYPGVMVRNVPVAAQAGRQKGWIYLKPGAKISDVKRRYGTRSGHVWYEAGKTAAGGTIAHVDPSFYPSTVAKVKHDGKQSHLEITY